MLHVLSRLALLGASLCLLAGCFVAPPANLPKVHHVTGKVLDAQGQPVASGTIQFESLDPPGMVSLGEIAADGSYRMRTMFEGMRLDGAVAGQQRVTYLPQMAQDQSAVPVVLKETVEVKEGENEIGLKL